MKPGLAAASSKFKVQRSKLKAGGCALLIVLLASCAMAQSLAPDKPAKEYIYVGGRLLAIETPASNGTTVAPFATIMEWTRDGTAQFDVIPTGSSGIVMTPTLRTTQINATYTVVPFVEWTYTSGAGPQFQYFLTKQAYAPTVDEDLVIEADIAYSALDQVNGVGCFDPATPTSNFYLLSRDFNGTYRLKKYVAGIQYIQGQDARSTESGTTLWGQKARVRFVVTKTGGVRVYSAGSIVFDLPMTLGNPTVLSSCRVGFVVCSWCVQYGGGFSFSRLRTFRMKPDGEQMF